MPDEPTTPTTETTEELRPFDVVMAELDRHLSGDPDDAELKARRDVLRHHNVIAGIAGEIGDTIANRRQQVRDMQTAEQTRKDEQARLLKLADDDPEAFAEQFKTTKQAELAAENLRKLAFDERKKLAEHIGRAFADLPEWQELTNDERAELVQAVNGVPDERVIGAYNAKATELVARKKAEKLIAAQLDTRLAAEKEAWTAEEAAKRVRQTAAPSLRSGAAAGNDTGEPDYRDKAAWDAWYEERHGLRRRVSA